MFSCIKSLSAAVSRQRPAQPYNPCPAMTAYSDAERKQSKLKDTWLPQSRNPTLITSFHPETSELRGEGRHA